MVNNDEKNTKLYGLNSAMTVIDEISTDSDGNETIETVTTNTDGEEIKSTFEVPDCITSGYAEVLDNNDIEIPTQNVKNIFAEEFVNDENAKTVSMLNLNSQLNDVTSMVDGLKAENNKFFSGDTDVVGDFIDMKLESVTEDQLKEMPDEEIDKFFDLEDNKIEFVIDFDNKKQEMEFKRDFLIFRYKTNITIRELDESVAKIQAEIEESRAEFDEVIEKYGNMNNWVRSTIEDKLAAADTDEKKELYINIKNHFDYAFTLDNLKEYLNTYKGKKIIPDFCIEKKQNDVYKRYIKVINTLHAKEQLRQFTNIESNFIGEEYAKRPNIFIFSIMHLIASQYKSDDLRAFGLFVTQFVINMKNLVLNKFDNEKEKENFINAIKEVIDIIG